MKIAEFKIHPIAIADPPLRSSYGLHAPYALRTIVELISDDKIVGISETYGGEAQVKQLEALRATIIGADPYRLTGTLMEMVSSFSRGACSRSDREQAPRLNERADRSQTWLVPGENPLDATTRTYAAIEVACLDLIGKSVRQPVCDLIGGRVRDEVPFRPTPSTNTPAAAGKWPIRATTNMAKRSHLRRLYRKHRRW